jgi:hypothetical protein
MTTSKKSFALGYAAAMLAAGAMVLASANGASAASRHSKARAAFGLVNNIRPILNKAAPGFAGSIPIIAGGLVPQPQGIWADPGPALGNAMSMMKGPVE